MNFDYETRYLKLNDGQVILIRYFSEGFVANVNRAGIEVGDLFYEFSELERECIVHHEQFHQTQSSWENLFARVNRTYSHKLEFCADYHAAQKTSRDDSISALERLRVLVEAGLLHPNHEKTHPRIEERIKRIKNINSSVYIC
jgi:hypothetical protein